ncbi:MULTISPECIES: surface-adhesin E family protein [unclassified Phenylobacterium]|uniref:surface-adhesin E family protein n=1 Tax=unclassified Phenylobacterium TaxID=2640670 RepID=UPI00083B556B|nr:MULTISPECIES: surface-adhesin E family protein [unclassified Phenylobacterium]
MRAASLGLVLAAACAQGAQAARPSTVPELVAWAQAHLTGVEDWPLLGFDASGMILASPEGAALRSDGVVEGDLRQEFFEPIELDGRVMRSAAARWAVDCSGQRYAILSMTLYARNNLTDQIGERTADKPDWRPRDAMSGAAIDAMCEAVRSGVRLDAPQP